MGDINFLEGVEAPTEVQGETSRDDIFTVKLSARPDDIENAETISLISGYLEYNTAGVVFGESGSGKSLFTLSVCVYLLENTMIERVNYYDFDNGKADQKNRGIHLLLRKYGDRFNYVNLESIDNADLTPPQILNGLIDTPLKGTTPYERQFFVFDTMGELAEGSLGKDEVMRPLLDKFKRLRSMGETIQTIHHTTKSKEEASFFGSNYIKIKIDALWHLTAKDISKKDLMEFALKNIKNRSGNLRDSGFIINPVTHTLEGADFTIASMDNEEAEFVSSVRSVLNEDDYVEMSQKDLLMEIGIDPKNKRYVELLKKYVGKFWNSRVNDFPKTVIYSTL